MLLNILPIVNQFDCFALKGGTAINLFIRNMPRLSIDIDLAYLLIEPREQFLKYFRIKTLYLQIYMVVNFAQHLRQHPRDLFDVKLLLETQGLTDEVRQAFIVYLLSSPRPMHELLNPTPDLKYFRKIFDEGFVGMTDIIVFHDELIEVQHVLIQPLLEKFTTDERRFLLTIKSGEPDWSLMPIPNMHQLPAIQWKIFNIKKMAREKRQVAFEKLRSVLRV